MPLPEDLTQHPSPAQVYELAVDYAALLRALFNHPGFKYLEPPTAEIYKIDPENTTPALFWIADFVQNSYVDYVIPLLPAGVTRKCKDLANPWAYADPNYSWELTWDPETESLKNAAGTAVKFPKLPASDVHERMHDLLGRGMMAKMLVLENGNDVKARLLLGGKAFDFGDEIKSAVQKLQ